MKTKKEGKARVLSKEEFSSVLQSVLSRTNKTYVLRDIAMMYVSFGLGLRVGEISKLRISDSKQSVMNLCSSWTKNKKHRVAYFESPIVAAAISEYLTERNSDNDNEPLFKSRKGWAFSPNALQNLFHNIYKEAGIVGASSHSGRRTFATRLIENGADIYSVSRLMGHSSVKITEGYFSDNPERMKRFVKGVL